MEEDPENLDELLDRLPHGLARKVAKHLNEGADGAAEDEAREPVEWVPIPPPPRPAPPPPDKSYDYSHLIRWPERRPWWRRQF